MTEANLSKRLRTLIVDELGGLYRRIEDASGNLGTPDVWLIVDGVEMWIELKHTETPGAKPTFRPGQRGFAKAVRKQGGLSWTMASNDRDSSVRLWEGGRSASEVPMYTGPLDLTLWALLSDAASSKVRDHDE